MIELKYVSDLQNVDFKNPDFKFIKNEAAGIEPMTPHQLKLSPRLSI